MRRAESRGWKAALKRTSLFASLDEAVLDLLVRELREVTLARKKLLVRQDDEANSLFVILEGRLEVRLEHGGSTATLPELGAGSVVGEVALIVGGKRSATVQALTRIRALELSRASLDRLVDAHPEVMEALTRLLGERMQRALSVGYLRELFGDPAPHILAEIEACLEWVHLETGQELFRQGDVADSAYITIIGRVCVELADARGVTNVLTEVGPGKWIGEMALLSESTRSATVYALRETQLVRMTSASFHRLVNKHPAALLQLARLLVERLQHQNQHATHRAGRTKVITVLPAHPGVDVTPLCEQLRAAFSRHGRVTHLSAQRINAALDKPGIAAVSRDDPAYLRLLPWLVEQETSFDLVLYQADGGWSGWNETVLRNSDQILVVADASEKPTLCVNELRLIKLFPGKRTPRCNLVLLQPAGGRTFPGTSRWLRQRDYVTRHYHVRRGARADVERLARIVTERAITLTLGGGGSRGCAHLGVLWAFEEHGIPVDAICGTSIGSFIGVMHALGLSTDDALQEVIENYASVLDPTLPFVSIASGRRVTLAGEGLLGELEIEDLALPYFCISVNLTRACEVVHRTGRAATAVRASCSLPGIYPPVPCQDGDLLVDGGLINNVPVDVMSRLYPGAAVAVDVMPEIAQPVGAGIPNYLSGWEVAQRFVNPWRAPINMPNILNILVRSATVASISMRRATEQSGEAGLFLKPPVSHWNLLNFRPVAMIADEGYRYAHEKIGRWWEANRRAYVGE
ncbi:MAG: cyclic nucleotide-binding and patatin-like phospholipase domain-containing protein [Nannocystaceae bacterium]|nr:cyclic nucleotide-binding domain-containing protein [Myxococcales bacterium]